VDALYSETREDSRREKKESYINASYRVYLTGKKRSFEVWYRGLWFGIIELEIIMAGERKGEA